MISKILERFWKKPDDDNPPNIYVVEQRSLMSRRPITHVCYIQNVDFFVNMFPDVVLYGPYTLEKARRVKMQIDNGTFFSSN